MRNILLVSIFLLHTNLWGNNDKDYMIYGLPYTSEEIRIDGNLGEWKTYYFVHFEDTTTTLHAPKEHPFSLDYPIEYSSLIKMPKSINEIDVYICWDLNYLYFGFNVSDKHLFAENNDSIENPVIYLNDGIEIYIDTQNDSEESMDINDYQFIIDVRNSSIVFKGNRDQMQKSEKFAVPKDYGQNVLFDHKVLVSGTLNDSLTLAKGYSLEARIPFVAIGIQPNESKMIKLEICNNDVDYFLHEAAVVDGKVYLTKPFNWIGYNEYGYPDQWLIFSLEGKANWMEKMSYHAKQSWIRFMLLLLILTLIVYLLLFYILSKYKRLPKISDVGTTKILIVSDNTLKKNLTEEQEVLQKATDFIVESRSEICSSEKVALYLGISLRKFQSITRKELKCTPTSFIYLVKLKQAAEYLKNKQGNISETAYEFGFSDPSYFSKIFKSHFGISPSQYIEKNG